ncbi:MAG: response regulator, partial [Gammaproteobacteria bacterium]|nr:response regulator [Gammaproteobacteria bacterium]
PNTRILLAEDNPANQMVIKKILEIADLQVDIVGDGIEAVEAVRSLPYDIVLMDISMPLMDGISATREIRRLPGVRADIPIIALTAHALADDRQCFIEAGMNDYLSKPVDRNATLYCIAQWTSGTRNEPVHAVTVGEQVRQESTGLTDDYVSEAVLWQLVRDTDVDIVADLLALYIADAQERVKLIISAESSSDIKLLEFESHTLGSSAAAHGNIKLQKSARRIERLCQGNKKQQAFAGVADLARVAEKSFRILESRIVKGFKLTNTG